MSKTGNGERGWLGPVIVRGMGISSTYVFDNMVDRHMIWIRHAPITGGVYEKSYVTFELPEGTPTPGLDALGWLLGIVENEEKEIRTLVPGSEVKHKEEK